MKITITARHFTASDQLREYTEKNVSKLTRFFDRITEIEVILTPFEDDNKPQSVEMIVRVPNDVLIAKEHELTYEKAVKSGVDNLTRQLKKYKDKKSS
jgi:ribosomal subunit interface protein